MADAVEVVSQCHERRQDEKAKQPHQQEIPLDRAYTVESSAIPQVFRRRGSLELDDYFTGPRDIAKHSKWPIILQLHGSIVPKLILPLILISLWASAIVVISAKVHYLGVNSVLLTLTGFVVSLSLSFRSSTAYERYIEGRKYWATLVQSSQVLGRVFWIHAAGRADSADSREVLLQKLGAMNLLVAYAVALKHSLRFEPYTAYPDLQNLVGHLDTFARAATEADPSATACRKRGFFRGVAEYLGVSFAASNPRKTIKRASKPLGNLPLEILNHIALATDQFIANEQIRVPIHQTMAFNAIQSLNDVMTGTERVLCTPLPIAYSIAISQISHFYLLCLPFQLIPLLHCGAELENPFGSDVNDLPLDSYCDQIAADLDIIASFDTRDPQRFLNSSSCLPLYPVSLAPASVWMQRGEERLRNAIRQKPAKTFEWRRWGTKKSTSHSSASTSAAGDNMV